ncbi:PH domain-containing protein [Colletotrichum tamarilloi]|uniref:PH domain-containing protein n=1 Tax=Colletotrichum tamarilloi TaxID=1209934 RepID=A0ABQ9RUY5_9PEZI|nr:PH domain-containing protein [Colletotrichum tamarilloi]KAK1512925.1 PH domain-containing protein [Colletotrichum tamarilloi]
MNYTQEYERGERRLRHEMREKAPMRDTFFGIKAEPQRPTSVATEFMDMEWDDDVLSEFEDNSPRISVNSSGGQPSITTLSSYDEVQTPRSSQGRMMYATEMMESPNKNIEGPSGPHLFRASTASYFDEAILTLSPVTPKTARPFDEPFRHIRPQQPPMPPSRHQSGPFQFTYEEFESRELVSWTPEMVAQSMLNAGIELSVAGRFVENDINGPILITLKFEDLKELDIPSFGMRTRVWNQIQVLRDSRPSSPRAPTPIQDEPSREVKKETREVRAAERQQTDDCGMKRSKSSRRRPKKPSHDDIITPMESVSIVGIEQVVPKPHQCPKGENCSKWRKQQRLIEAFKKEHPFVDLDTEQVVITGNPGNPHTARALDPTQILRPVSDAVPSVVASSDVLGPGNATPLQYLQEAALRNVISRDPQDNVRQFLDFQKHEDTTVPPTPPFEMGFPAMKAQPERLRHLPKLSIPGKQAPRASPLRASTVPPPSAHPEPLSTPPYHQQQQPQGFVPYHMDRAEAMSPDLQSPINNPYRFGTPFSEMDVPVTAVPMDRIARDVSQSVPPEMNYRPGVSKQQQPPLSRTQSRSSARRPSFPVLPALNENTATPIARTSPRHTSPRTSVRPQPLQQQQPLQAPPRVNYPWSPIERTTPFEQAIPPITHLAPSLPVKQAASAAQQDGVTFQGPMKKRKTKMLRHEWNDTFCTLKGTRLAVHKDAKTVDRTLEYVDVDDYAIACSSLASQSKLSAAFKAVHFSSSSSHSREKSDPVAAFSFQLIPQDKDKESAGAKLRKRGSALHGFGHGHSSSSGSIPAEGANGTGKTHHFAVKSRDDRIDWMRELMLAKALKQKGDGFEVSVNGNMI